MTNELFNHLTALFGNHCGVNADWESYAWCITDGCRKNLTSGAHYLVENDDSFAIVQQIVDDEEGLTETMEIFEFADDMALRKWLKDSKLDQS